MIPFFPASAFKSKLFEEDETDDCALKKEREKAIKKKENIFFIYKILSERFVPLFALSVRDSSRAERVGGAKRNEAEAMERG